MDLVAGSEVKIHQKLHLPKENGLLALVTVKKQACPDVKYSEGFNQQSTANYQYDLAGNVTYDPNKKVTFLYNHLNLAYQMIGSENDTLTMIYGADGRLLQRRYKQNQSIIQKIDYLSNVEVLKDTVKEIYHKDGRLEKKNGIWQYEYWLKDHLGNLRSAFRDINNDSYISQNEITSRNDYYAFGLEMAGSYLLNGNRFAYGGKERLEQMNLGLLDFGARSLDKALGRWLGVDPLADHPNQVDKSPYAAMWNNPIKYNDPDGRCPNCITGAIGAGIGALIGGGIEIASQLYNNGSVNDWSAVGGSALQGGITGGAAGFTGGASLLTTAAVAGGANVVGGTINRTIQGQQTTLGNVLTDATVGAVFGAGGKLIGSGLSSLSSSVSKQATSKLTNIASKVLADAGEGSGAVYGTKAHSALAKAANGLKIGDNLVRTEVSYLNGEIVKHGTKGSARIDAGLYNSKGQLIQVFDLKTGGSKLTTQQVQHIQTQTRTQVTVSEIRRN
jgi:RHS repeat-associated protein